MGNLLVSKDNEWLNFRNAFSHDGISAFGFTKGDKVTARHNSAKGVVIGVLGSLVVVTWAADGMTDTINEAGLEPKE